ncbi:LSM domain protein [Raphanus sativus]|nr:LSM domain protein [Raphanus sativus]
MCVLTSHVASFFPLSIALREREFNRFFKVRPQGFKLAIKARPNRGSGGGGGGSGVEKNLLRSVEETNKGFCRTIFNVVLQKAELVTKEKNRASAVAMNAEIRRTKARLSEEVPKLQRLAVKRRRGRSSGGRTSRVAIITDREKDRYDPDYDRHRYVRVTPPVKDLRIEGRITGFDEYMTLVLDEAEEVNLKKNTKKPLVDIHYQI